jgi:hypothetical protein
MKSRIVIKCSVDRSTLEVFYDDEAPFASVLQLKHAIEEQHGIAMSHQTLIANGAVLGDDGAVTAEGGSLVLFLKKPSAPPAAETKEGAVQSAIDTPEGEAEGEQQEEDAVEGVEEGGPPEEEELTPLQAALNDRNRRLTEAEVLELMYAEPETFQPIFAALVEQNPQIAGLAQRNPQRMASLMAEVLNQSVEQEPDGSASTPPLEEAVEKPELSAEQNEALAGLEAMFPNIPQRTVLESFVACGCDGEATANLLFEY